MKSIPGDFAGKASTPQQEASSLSVFKPSNNLTLCCLPEAGDGLKCLTAVSAAPLTSTGISSEHGQLLFLRKIFFKCSHPTAINLLSHFSNTIIFHYSRHRFHRLLFRELERTLDPEKMDLQSPEDQK